MRSCSLTEERTTAGDHIWLSPQNRLLADAPNISHFTLDLADRCLVLPPGLSASSSIPLIVLGADCTLRITNGTIYNAESMAACLSLGPGANFLAEESDAVQWQDGAPEHLDDPAAAFDRTQDRSTGLFSMQTLTSGRAQDPSARMQVQSLVPLVCLLASAGSVSGIVCACLITVWPECG